MGDAPGDAPEDEMTGAWAETPAIAQVRNGSTKKDEPQGSGVYVYQLSFSAENLGKLRKKKKKMITWEFGMANDQVHSVSLTWSKRSGKQSVEMDGTEIWFGRQKGAGIFSHQWTTNDGLLKLHILASWVTPERKRKKLQGFHKYVLMINSRSFFSLPLQDGSAPVEEEAMSSIVDILYPDGYDWNDKRFAEKLPPLPSTADRTQSNAALANMVTARRPVRHDGTPR